MERMNGEERCDESAAPKRPRQLFEQEKEKEHARSVQQNVNKMMSARFQTKKLTIEHVRYGRERMPVVGVSVRKGPDNVFPARSRLDLTILADVCGIVVINKSVSQGLAEDTPGDGDQYGADRDFRK